MNRQRIIYIVLLVVLVLCLVGALITNVFFRNQGGDVAGVPPTATPAATEAPTEAPTATPTKAEPTATPTQEKPTATVEPVESEAEAATATPTVPPTPTPLPTQPAAAASGPSYIEVNQIGELLQNGGFEEGFAGNGVGLGWQGFHTGDAQVNFSAESAEPFIRSGSSAQRISIDQAWQPDQFGGIFQTVEVVPGQPYTVTVHGQIRSNFGSVEASSYGYRLQMALDESGGQNWRAISQTHWIELPWPEQSLQATTLTFSEYSAPFTPTTDRVTLFIRSWNKWPDGNLGEYTLDDVSLFGAQPGQTQLVEVPAPAGGEPMVDKPLPETGFGDDYTLAGDGRFWGALLMLLVLAGVAGGALLRAGRPL